ncbi:RNA polymerase subunit sigma-24 [Niastella koreensis]|uniref:RNA polymerase, sigma-24 subunit, ECF subfamily n=2 Tax=Niastella koreensis TaxID=354356 RepID=G8TJI7_NIAKG|nr:sigma factor [Niastella koreensis]AEV99722.1 RNA polymerase, sigma-24 subunit, ECF subfamily [Niastella koreensis GR20-10]OQP51652.1 RNA polymerase subunit sigma-24 [Niastella koreensis]
METTTEVLQLRPYLFTIAYSMLGEIEEAEDIVQDIYEKWLAIDNVKEPKAYMARMVVNKSIKRLNEMRVLRETYTGTWLPEPFITTEVPESPTIEYGLLFLLERLNPVERAIFILRESFREEYSYIAELTGLSMDNCRQTLHRTYDKLGRSPKLPVDTEKHNALIEAFLVSMLNQDRSSLEQILRSDIELFGDGGGKRSTALKPLFGFEKVQKFLLGVMQLPENQGDVYEFMPAYVNGVPAALLLRKADKVLDSITYFVHDDRLISRLLFVRNPDKLKFRNP